MVEWTAEWIKTAESIVHIEFSHAYQDIENKEFAEKPSVTTHGLPHYEYLICQTGTLTFTSLLIVLWLTHTDLPIPLPFALLSSLPFALATICVPPSAQLLYSLCPLP